MVCAVFAFAVEDCSFVFLLLGVIGGCERLRTASTAESDGCPAAVGGTGIQSMLWHSLEDISL